MSDRKLVWLLLLTSCFFVAGCAKKSSEQMNISSTGFDSATATPATTSEELAQLPQAMSTSSAVEALPIETSPVTQSVANVTAIGNEIVAIAKDRTRDQEIQTALKNAGLYNGKIDGKLGPASKKAIEEFQTQNGLKADGKVGPKTWAALSANLSGATSEAVSTVETTAGNQ